MIKQAVIIRYEDKPVMVLPITTFQSAEDFVKFEKECRDNFKELIESNEHKFAGLLVTVINQQKQIDILKAEVKYVKGEITEEEYTKLIGEGE